MGGSFSSRHQLQKIRTRNRCRCWQYCREAAKRKTTPGHDAEETVAGVDNNEDARRQRAFHFLYPQMCTPIRTELKPRVRSSGVDGHYYLRIYRFAPME